jgi:hypothetical protein
MTATEYANWIMVAKTPSGRDVVRTVLTSSPKAVQHTICFGPSKRRKTHIRTREQTGADTVLYNLDTYTKERIKEDNTRNRSVVDSWKLSDRLLALQGFL